MNLATSLYTACILMVIHTLPKKPTIILQRPRCDMGYLSRIKSKSISQRKARKRYKKKSCIKSSRKSDGLSTCRGAQNSTIFPPKFNQSYRYSNRKKACITDGEHPLSSQDLTISFITCEETDTRTLVHKKHALEHELNTI